MLLPFLTPSSQMQDSLRFSSSRNIFPGGGRFPLVMNTMWGHPQSPHFRQGGKQWDQVPPPSHGEGSHMTHALGSSWHRGRQVGALAQTGSPFVVPGFPRCPVSRL